MHGEASEELQLDVTRDTSIWNLKQAFAINWHVPPSCQKLILGTAVPDDSDRLLAYCASGAKSLSMKVLVVLDAICVEMASANREKMMRALGDLRTLGRRGGNAAVGAMTCCLYDGDRDIRRFAVEVIEHIAAKGYATAVALLCAKTTDADRSVRIAAIKALPAMATKGDKSAVLAVEARLRDKDRDVKLAALRSLPELVEKDDATAIKALKWSLEDPNRFVRRLALQALPLVAESGNATAISAVSAHLADPDIDVRSSAKQVMDSLSKSFERDWRVGTWLPVCHDEA